MTTYILESRGRPVLSSSSWRQLQQVVETIAGVTSWIAGDEHGIRVSHDRLHVIRQLPDITVDQLLIKEGITRE